jgi:hypothetical protein
LHLFFMKEQWWTGPGVRVRVRAEGVPDLQCGEAALARAYVGTEAAKRQDYTAVEVLWVHGSRLNSRDRSAENARELRLREGSSLS